MDEFGTLITSIATALLAVLTFLLWRLQKSQHETTHFALLRVAISRAMFDSSTGFLRVEVLMLNEHTPPAVIQGWEVLVKDGTYQESIADGIRGRTRLIRAEGFIGDLGWIVKGDEASALCISKQLSRPVGENGEVAVEVHYAGGRTPTSTLSETITVELGTWIP